MTDPQTLISVPGAPNLAIDVQPDGAGESFVLDDSLLDDPDLLGWPNPIDGQWLNVVCDATRVRLRRGATRLQGPLTRAEAGEATIELLDALRRFDPLINADAIHAGTPVRVRAWEGTNPAAPAWQAVLMTATLADVPVVYPRTGPPRVVLTAADVIADLASWSSSGRPDPGVGAGQTLLERVETVIAEMTAPIAVSPDVDTTYAATLASTPLADAWPEIVAAADAELGRVWVDASNRLVVRGRESLLSGPVRGTLSDWHGEAPFAPHCCYDDLAAALGTEGMINRTIASRRVPREAKPAPVDVPTITAAERDRLIFLGWRGRPEDETERLYPPEPIVDSVVVQLDDTVSQARYRKVAAITRNDLELATDEQVGPWCESLLTTSSRPELRVDTVSPAPWGAGPEAWRAVCETDIGDRWALRFHPEIGPTVLRTVGVLGVEHEITPGSWEIFWTLTDAPAPGDSNPLGWFTLDVSDLDGGDLLAVFPSARPWGPAYDATTGVFGAGQGNLDATHAALAGGALRELAVGDSITYGQGATTPAADSWPAKLPAELAARGYAGTVVSNVGIPGSTTADWVATGLPASHTSFAPTVTTLALGTNDAVQRVPLATYTANLTTLVQRYRAIGEVLLIAPIPQQQVDLAPYVAACYRVAAEQGVPVLDLFRRWGSYAERAAVGWYADSTHPSTAGYADLARAVAGALVPPSGSPAVA